MDEEDIRQKREARGGKEIMKPNKCIEWALIKDHTMLVHKCKHLDMSKGKRPCALYPAMEDMCVCINYEESVTTRQIFKRGVQPSYIPVPANLSGGVPKIYHHSPPTRTPKPADSAKGSGIE